MKTFRTPIATLNHQSAISHDGAIMMCGSCFSDNIGAKLDAALFNVDINPFGTTFNPASIRATLLRIVENTHITRDELFIHNGLWHSFAHHSRFSSANQDMALDMMNSRIHAAHNHLKNAKTLIITLGTTRCYSADGNIVNNCHKLPASRFQVRDLQVDEVTEILSSLVAEITGFNSEIKFIFTVSPIRHISDGLPHSQLSKSILRVAADKITSLYPENCIYFPAYEIMMDDLRDYRFYSADMIHPNEVAIEYIWELFSGSFFSKETIEIAAKCSKLSQRLSHRHITDNKDTIMAFNAATLKIGNELMATYPYLNKLVTTKLNPLTTSL